RHRTRTTAHTHSRKAIGATIDVQCPYAVTTARARRTACAPTPTQACPTANASRAGRSAPTSTAPSVPNQLFALRRTDSELLTFPPAPPPHCSLRAVPGPGPERVLGPRVVQPHVGPVLVPSRLARG